MRPVFVRAFNMIKIGVVHSVVELFLGQSFFFGLFRFPPEFVPGFMTKVVLAVNRLTGISIQKLPLTILLSPVLDFLPHFLPDIRSM